MPIKRSPKRRPLRRPLLSREVEQGEVAFDDDGDGWWSGVNLNSVAIPIAAAASALVATAALGFQLNSANDDVVPQPQAGGNESTQIIAVGDDPLPVAFIADDDIVPQPVTPALEEGEWQPPIIASVSVQFAVFQHQDERSPTVEESEWQAPPPQTASALPPTWADDELPVTPATIVDEDYWQQPPSVAPFAVAQASSANDETTSIRDEEPWAAPLVIAETPRISLPAWNDEIGTATSTVVEDDYWLVLERLEPDIQIVSFPPGASAPAVETFLGMDEEPWQVYTPPAPKPVLLVFGFNDEAEQITLTFDAPSGGMRAQFKPTILRWNSNDDVAPQATPLFSDEGEWLPRAPLVPAVVNVWGGEEEVFPVASEEDYWLQLRAFLVPLAPPATIADDDIVPQAAPLNVVDDYWQVYTPPLPVPFVRNWEVDPDTPELVEDVTVTPERGLRVTNRFCIIYKGRRIEFDSDEEMHDFLERERRWDKTTECVPQAVEVVEREPVSTTFARLAPVKPAPKTTIIPTTRPDPLRSEDYTGITYTYIDAAAERKKQIARNNAAIMLMMT